MIDPLGNGFDLFLDGAVQLVGEGEVVRLFAQTDNFLSQLDAAFAALAPNLGQSNVDAQLLALRLDELQFGLGVGGEAVDGHHAGQLVNLGDVLNMLQQVGQTFFQSLQVLLAGLGLGHAAVVLQGSCGSNQNHAGGLQTSHTALDVQELLSAQVSAEASLGDGVVAQLQSDLGSGNGVTAVGNVGKGTAVNESGGVLQGLNQVGLQSVLQQSGHGALSVQVAGGDGLAGIGVANHQTGQTSLQVGDVGGQTQNGHDFGSDSDVVAVLTGGAVDLAAQAVHHEAELTVIHIDAAAPGDLTGVDAQSVALVDMVIEHRSQQVVGSADGVEVTGKVEVDVFHGDDLCVAAAGSAALDAEHGSQGGLTQSHHYVFADLTHTVSQAHGGGSLAFTSGGGVDGGHQDQLAVGLVSHVLENIVVNLCLVVAVLLQVLFVHASGLGNLADVEHRGFLCDFDVGFVSHVNTLLVICWCLPFCEDRPIQDLCSYRCNGSLHIVSVS